MAGLESTIDALMRATGIADDNLRPSLGRLIRSFKNTDKASRAMKIALDISGRTGKDLESVVEAMGKAADGSNTALLRLGTGLSKADLKGKSLDEVMALLETRFKGGAADAANTFEGRMDRLRARFGEIFEEVGYKVLPIFERLADMAIRVADAFAKDGLAGAIQQFKQELVMAEFANSGIGKFIGQMYDAVRAVYNLIAEIPGVDAKSLPSWAVQMDRMREGAALSANSYMGYRPVSPQREDALLRQFGALFSRGIDPVSAARAVAPGIVINVSSGDPAAIVDADMRFPKDSIRQLLARDEDIVAANYSTRKLPLQPVAFRDDLTSERVYTEEWCSGLEEVSAIGMGLMLIRAEVFRKMAKPWFHIHYQNGVYSGEDIWFCRSARETGFKVMLDHDISHHVRHIGAFEFSCAHAAASRGE